MIYFFPQLSEEGRCHKEPMEQKSSVIRSLPPTFVQTVLSLSNHMSFLLFLGKTRERIITTKTATAIATVAHLPYNLWL